MAIIVVDPGHGGAGDLGGSTANRVVGRRGLKEKVLTLDVGRRLAERLEASGHTVVLTRYGDTNVSARDRAARAKRERADVFLSIHFNGSPDASEQGTEALVRPRGRGDLDPRDARLADAVRGELARELGLADRGSTHGPWNVLDEGHHAEGTARCISEVCYLTDPHQEERLNNAGYRERIARALAKGVDRALGQRSSQRAGARGLATDWCQIRFNIIKSADEEQGFWLDSAGNLYTESSPDVFDMLVKYWQEGVGLSAAEARRFATRSAADDEDYPWSAAFVSWVMRNAGVTTAMGFDFSAKHITYIVGALRNRERAQRDRPFWLYGVDEIAPQPGDIICKTRSGGAAYTYASLKRDFFDNGNDTKSPSGKSHTDVAIGCVDRGGTKYIQVIGGNTGDDDGTQDTVGMKEYELDAAGMIVRPSRYNVFGIIHLIECPEAC